MGLFSFGGWRGEWERGVRCKCLYDLMDTFPDTW